VSKEYLINKTAMFSFFLDAPMFLSNISGFLNKYYRKTKQPVALFIGFGYFYQIMKLLQLTYRRRPIYYGWIIAVGLGVLNMISVNLLTVNFGLFIRPIGDELGISHSLFGWSQTARLIGVALSGLIVGRILDKYGTRRPLIVVSLIVLTSMTALARISNGWQMIVVFVLIGTVGMSPSGGNLYAIVPLSHWFIRKRGKAMSIAFIGLPIGIFFLMPLAQLLINRYGWRSTITILGIGSAIIIFLIALLITRRPEDKGLLPDGDPPNDHPELNINNNENSTALKEKYSWTRTEAIHCTAFWKLTLATGIFFFACTMLSAFRVPLFVIRGIEPMLVSYALSLEAATSIAASFSFPYLMSRFPIRYLMAISTMGVVVFFIISIYTSSVWHVFMAQFVIGLSIQARFVFEGDVWPAYFGKQNLGSIRGLVVPVSMAFSFLSGPIAGKLFDTYDSYTPAWWISVILLIISVILLLGTPEPSPFSKT